MSSLHIHEDAGAYALGVLDAADAFRFEEHLPGCAACRGLVAGFGSLTALLAAYAAGGAIPPAPVPGEVPLRMLGAVARRRRRGRALRIALVAASGVLVAGGIGVVLEPTAAPRWRVASHAPGVTATLVTAPMEWGTDVELGLAGAAPLSCTLVAVGRDGTEQTVATWAGRGGRPVRMRGAAALAQDAIARFEVRAADGTRPATLTPARGAT
ncbi:zf-HC2 domain-containing protein [Streptomyces sp. SDr-06]|uniref:zf-HC2 domain-containing protein n=1 Tax=Streptomyces sp. SDr-06 TaxID=2267702 RepID=UPI000DEB938D|nr:zf-HC2 domain-containing protein [Streptomyces sp. SDr-06]RCH65644.1 zf-HC2 domain-containing protein [Streptomyces sp. SDr-06]